MSRRVCRLLGVIVLAGFTIVAERVSANDSPEIQRLLDRIRALEERLDKLERVEVIKKTTEYLCPGGEIFDQPPPGGRCPDRSRPEVRETVRKSILERRESIAEKIDAALREEAGKKVAIGGAARGIVQQVLHATPGQDKTLGEGAVDLTLIFRPMVRTTMFVDLEAIGGSGPDRVLGTLSRVNADADKLGSQDEKLTAREAWLSQRWIDDRLDTILGKLDPANYFDRNAFANDETTQFLNAALVNNPMLKQPPNGPGGVVRWDAGRDLGFSLGGHAPADLGKSLVADPYVIGEIDVHSARFIDGNYRWWARTGTLPDNRRKSTWGSGISLDQLLTPTFGLFARAGFSRIEGESPTLYAFSGGLRLTAPFGGRTRDRFGVGFSFQREREGDETVAETYYNFFLTDHLSISADLQGLFSGPNLITGKKNRGIVIPGVRAVVPF